MHYSYFFRRRQFVVREPEYVDGLVLNDNVCYYAFNLQNYYQGAFC